MHAHHIAVTSDSTPGTARTRLGTSQDFRLSFQSFIQKTRESGESGEATAGHARPRACAVRIRSRSSRNAREDTRQKTEEFSSHHRIRLYQPRCALARVLSALMCRAPSRCNIFFCHSLWTLISGGIYLLSDRGV